ncbi:MAG: C39 family peptidase [Verrucomicrobiota bacterium]|nr:C39 family peptidase [Verrucomicrobiota bacterium]
MKQDLVVTSLGRIFFAAIVLLAVETGLAQQSPSPTPSATVPVIPLDPWLTSTTLWETSNLQFPEGRALGFHWVSNSHEAARASSSALRLGDLQVAEVIARFALENSPVTATTSAATTTGNLSAVQISIYNRGDSGNLDKNAFDALVQRSKAELNSLTGVTSLERGTDNGSAVQSHGLVWVTPASRFLLEWSDTPANRVQGIDYRAEFIRLRVTPQRDQPRTFVDQVRAQSMLAAGAAQPKTVHASDLPARLIKEKDGSEWLPNIPMVNQGRKGYCVTAATERILRYYGVEVDQNELAQIADADARAGTSPEVMLDALKKLASRFRVQVMTEYRLSYSDFVREINDYNRVARNAPKSTGATLINQQSSIANYPLVCHEMKGDLLLEAKTKLNPAYMTTFEREVQTHIERGIPLLWSVQLGMLPEEKLNPNARGGHMRLIVGLNPKTHEIYYSDTWGLGHELKKMPLANAWTITDGLFTLEPS